MDIFSATSRQVGTTVAPKALETASVRETEKTSEASKAAPEHLSKEGENTLTKTVNELNQQMDKLETNIAFGFNDEISMLYVSVMEKRTGKTIRKIPTEEAMELSAKMKEIVGIIFDKKG